MGTNYYFVQNECECCLRNEQVHIGKRSGGWMFSFHGLIGNVPHVRSWKEWQTEIKNSEIFKPVINEYGERFTFEEFSKIVENSKNEKLNHYDYCAKNHSEWQDDSEWKDEDGWSFSSRDFS